MKNLFVLFLLCSACTADVFSQGDDAAPASSSPTAPPSRFARLQTDAGDETSDAGVADAGCALVDHWNGYNPFQSCETGYSETLALQACASYFGVGCASMSDAGCGPNVVGAKSVAWILWGWPDEAGIGHAHESAFAACPGQPNDPTWW